MIKSDRSADVLTRDRIIDKIAAKIEPETGTYIFDASGMIVSAGLVDAHVHMEGPEADKYGINVEMSAIPFGVTAVADAGGAHGNGFLANNRLVKNVTFVGVTVRDNVVSFEKPEDKLTLSKIGGLILGILGIFAINTDLSGFHFQLGDLLILGASFCTVFSNVISKKAFKTVAPIVLICAGILVANYKKKVQAEHK